MKSKIIELDVDFIGVQSSGLTPDEVKALSEYFAKKKLTANKKTKTRTVKRNKAKAS